MNQFQDRTMSILLQALLVAITRAIKQKRGVEANLSSRCKILYDRCIPVLGRNKCATKFGSFVG